MSATQEDIFWEAIEILHSQEVLNSLTKKEKVMVVTTCKKNLIKLFD